MQWIALHKVLVLGLGWEEAVRCFSTTGGNWPLEAAGLVELLDVTAAPASAANGIGRKDRRAYCSPTIGAWRFQLGGSWAIRKKTPSASSP